LKTSTEIVKWFNRSKDIERDFKVTAMLMEQAGTGGALFRNLYRDFLKECYELLKLETLEQGHQEFIEIADLWTETSNLFIEVSRTKDMEYIKQASDLLKTISAKEKKTMETLATAR
jgi:hypothetical protein